MNTTATTAFAFLASFGGSALCAGLILWRINRALGYAARRYAQDRRGVTSLEYGIIAGVVGLALIIIFRNFGIAELSLFKTIAGRI